MHVRAKKKCRCMDFKKKKTKHLMIVNGGSSIFLETFDSSRTLTANWKDISLFHRPNISPITRHNKNATIGRNHKP